tara:strand:+ start:87 stop:320 length:234 start_codon:yes stop_codon:yes gene_type:complete
MTYFEYEHLDQALVAVARLARFNTYSGSVELSKRHVYDSEGMVDSTAWVVEVRHNHIHMEEVRSRIQEIGGLDEWVG